MSSDSANGTLDADNDGVAVGKAATIARDTVPEASESADHVVQSGPQLSEFVLRVVDRIAATRNKIRDCKTDIETQKGWIGKWLTCFISVYERIPLSIW